MWNSKFKSLTYNSSRKFWNLFSCLFGKNNTIKAKLIWVQYITPCPIKEKKTGITHSNSEFNCIAIEYAENNSNHKAAEKLEKD